MNFLSRNEIETKYVQVFRRKVSESVLGNCDAAPESNSSIYERSFKAFFYFDCKSQLVLAFELHAIADGSFLLRKHSTVLVLQSVFI